MIVPACAMDAPDEHELGHREAQTRYLDPRSGPLVVKQRDVWVEPLVDRQVRSLHGIMKACLECEQGRQCVTRRKNERPLSVRATECRGQIEKDIEDRVLDGCSNLFEELDNLERNFAKRAGTAQGYMVAIRADQLTTQTYRAPQLMSKRMDGLSDGGRWQHGKEATGPGLTAEPLRGFDGYTTTSFTKEVQLVRR